MARVNDFKDPIGVTKRESGKMPWGFQGPIYDRRCSRNIKAGDDYGVGHRQPVGHDGDPKERVDTMPMKARMFKSDL